MWVKLSNNTVASPENLKIQQIMELTKSTTNHGVNKINSKLELFVKLTFMPNNNNHVFILKPTL
jgi:hypothetical protein